MKNCWRNKMKNFDRIIIKSVPLLLLIALVVLACKENKGKESHKHEEYTCSMHPQVLQDKPGSCPICGMDLIKKSHDGNKMIVTDEVKTLTRPTNSSVVASIKTIHPERKTLPVTAMAQGVINYDTRNTYSVPVRFGGRIEKLYLKYNYQPVKKGQVIMELYSPEIVTAQRELLYVVNEKKSDTEILNAAMEKLRLLGLTKGQIEQVIDHGKESYSIAILSPYSGYIIESGVSSSTSISANSIQPSSMGGGMGKKPIGGMQTAASTMNASLPSSTLGSQFSIREGMYVTTGQSVFNVVDGTRLWAELYFSANEGKEIHKNDKVDLLATGLDETISARIDFIQPFFSEGKQFLQVRSYLDASNTNKLRVGQLVTAQLTKPETQSLWIPKISVLDLGVQQIVFIKRNGTFTPFKIKTGSESEGWIEVKEGLDESIEIAANAQYLVDSESFIKVMNP